MTVKERNQDQRMVDELVRVHLPRSLDDSELCRDILAVVAVNLRRIAVDTEKSAAAWDKRAYHTKAEELRHDMDWVLPAAQIVESLAYSPRKFTQSDLDRLLKLVPVDTDPPVRPRFKDINVLRGAAAAARQTLLKKK